MSLRDRALLRRYLSTLIGVPFTGAGHLIGSDHRAWSSAPVVVPRQRTSFSVSLGIYRLPSLYRSCISESESGVIFDA